MDGSGGTGVESINSANDATMNRDGHNSEGADGRFRSVWTRKSLLPTPEGTCSRPGPSDHKPLFQFDLPKPHSAFAPQNNAHSVRLRKSVTSQLGILYIESSNHWVRAGLSCACILVRGLFQKGIYVGRLQAPSFSLLARLTSLLEQIAKGFSGPHAEAHETCGGNSSFPSS